MTRRSDSRPVPLRETLRAALSMRQAALWRGRSRRKDQDRLNAAIGRVERFLHNYPVANDAVVRTWCRAHIQDVSIIVPGNRPTVLARLIMDTIKPKEQAA